MTTKKNIDLSEFAKKLGYNLSTHIIDRWLSFFGKERTLKLLKENEKPMPETLRVNTLKIEPELLIERLSAKKFEFNKNSQVEYAYTVTKKGTIRLGATHEYLQGLYAIQSLSSQLPVIVLNPGSSGLVLDMTAAPGSKTTQLAQEMENQGVIVALERSSRRVQALCSNISRMGIENTLVVNIDATKVPKYEMEFDKILLDAPCTGSGIIRKDPRRKRSKSTQDIILLSKVQKKLLRVGVDILAPGGVLVYSTCSLEPEENEGVINTVLQKDGVFIENIDIIGGNAQNGLLKAGKKEYDPSMNLAKRIFPSGPFEGFFICKLRKEGRK